MCFATNKSDKGLTSGQWFAMFWQTLMQAVWVRDREREGDRKRDSWGGTSCRHTKNIRDEVKRDEGRLGKLCGA